jgi:hypothetical protein
LVYHGDVYREYRRRVPGLIPNPWHRLNREQADALLRRGQQPPDPTA